METFKQCSEEHCLTCADALLSVRVVLLLAEEENIALVEVGGRQEEVDISLVKQVRPGDILLVHGGVALSLQEPSFSGASVGAST